MASQYDIAVVGGGIAGLTAVQHALHGGCRVAHIVGSEPIGGLVCNVGELHGYPAGDDALSGIGLAVNLSSANTAAGATEIYGDAHSLAQEAEGFRLRTDDDELVAKQVIVATGARLRMLDVPGAQDLVGRGVSQCAWCDGALYKGKDVVVVGGGDAALEEALHLTQFASKVTVVTRGDGFRARQSNVSKIADIDTVQFRWMTDVAEIVGTDAVEAIRLTDKESGENEEVSCSGVFVFVGLAPSTGLIGDLATFGADGGVLTDEHMQSRTPGLFAIGAVRSGYRGRLVHAVGEAATAAMGAAANCAE